VLYRRKAGYPPTDDPRYDAGLDGLLAEVVADADAPIRPLLDLTAAKSYLADPGGPAGNRVNRFTKEIMVSLNEWLGAYRVRLEL
jgi:hypothetical protein